MFKQFVNCVFSQLHDVWAIPAALHCTQVLIPLRPASSGHLRSAKCLLPESWEARTWSAFGDLAARGSKQSSRSDGHETYFESLVVCVAPDTSAVGCVPRVCV